MLLTAATFAPVLGNQFINYDDNLYVTANRHVLAGLGGGGIRWAFTSFHAANWHPLTWLSHMVDVGLFGLRPRGHHLTSLILHLLNTALLFLVLRRATGALWAGGATAALFAVHPLHVESVAWVAERKDVLSGLFFMLTLLLYIGYTRRPGALRFFAVFAMFGLGLLAKPMLVTLPFVLLLLDWWPLGRFPRPGSAGRAEPEARAVSRLFLEKLPLLALAAASSVVTYRAQMLGDAIALAGNHPLAARLADLSPIYLRHLRQMAWPAGLAVFYPRTSLSASWWFTTGALLTVGLLTAVAVRTRRRQPYLATGWFWYLGTLFPVVGPVAVGEQLSADRYTYLPLIGMFVILTHGLPDLLGRRIGPKVLGGVAGLALALLAALSWRQVGYWHDSVALFGHALAVTANNDVAHLKLGDALAAEGDRAGSLREYIAALKINPEEDEENNNVGVRLSEQGRFREAIAFYTTAITTNPRNKEAHNNLGVSLLRTGRPAEAMARFAEALRLDPGYANARFNLGLALAAMGRGEEARKNFEAAAVSRAGRDERRGQGR